MTISRNEAQRRYYHTKKGKATESRFRATAKYRHFKRNYDKEYYATHPEFRQKLIRRQRIKRLRNYGLTIEEYEARFIQQDGKCACCGEPEKLINVYTKEIQFLSVDHDHNTNAVRGLVCAECNRFVIPAAEHWEQKLPLAIKYLKKGEIMNLVGKVAALKASGERVFILNENDAEYTVRRPVLGQNGITHQIETYFKEELETLEQNAQSELNEMVMKSKLQREAFRKAEAEALASPENEAEAAEPNINVIPFKKLN